MSFSTTIRMHDSSLDGTAQLRRKQSLLWLLCIVFFLLGSLATASASEKLTYLHTDNLGSVIAGTDESGNLLWREEYEPYGLRRIQSFDAEGQRLWYTGHAHDEGLSLSYFGARWYDPDAGRFLAVDPVDWVEDNPMHSFNRYAYANNNPYKYVDPDGREPHRWADGNYSDNDGQENPGRWVQINRAYGQVGGGIAEGWASHPAAIVGTGVGLGALFAKGGMDKWSRVPKSIQDQMALEAAKRGAGSKIRDNLGDPRFKGMEKWEYKVKSKNGQDSVIHYNRNPQTGDLMDFKFKKHSTHQPKPWGNDPAVPPGG